MLRRFRCALVRLGLFEAVPGEVNRRLCAHGLKVEACVGGGG